jgi:hypothetical protein
MKFSILSQEQALATIVSIAKSGNQLQNKVQSIAVTAIGYANVHGDVTIANRAFVALKDLKGIKLSAFTAYLEEYGCLALAKDGFVHAKRDDVERDPLKLVALLSKTAWHTPIKRESAVEVNLVDALRKLAAKAESASKKGLKPKGYAALEILTILANEIEEGLHDEGVIVVDGVVDVTPTTVAPLALAA